MKILFLCLIAVLLVNQLNAQHLRARQTGSRDSTRGATRDRSGARQPTNSRQPTHSRQPQTTTTTTTTTPSPTNDETIEDTSNPKYYGTYLGSFETKVHGVQGDVFAVDESTVFIKKFYYDGDGPDAYFWAGTSTDLPDENGFIIPDEKGSTKPLAKYIGQNLVLRLPEGKTLRDLTYISVWCRKVSANFGHLELKTIVKTATIPTAIEIRPLSQLDHGVKSGPINIIDAQTFLITDFHYDGQGPQAFWWATKGEKQTPQGLKIPDENGSLKPLRRYGGETVVITLPDNKTIYDYDYFGLWCEEYFVDFGHTRIPHNILVPPSAKMLGVKHEVLYGDLYNENETTTVTTTTTVTSTAAPLRSLNNHSRAPLNSNLRASLNTNSLNGNSLNSNTRAASRAQLNQHIRANNNLSINRSIVETSRLQTSVTPSSRGGRRPPQRRPSLDNKPELDRFEHSRPIAPISNSISSPLIRREPARREPIHREPISREPIPISAIINRQPLNPLVGSPVAQPAVQPVVNTPTPITSLVPNSRPNLVPVSNSIAAPNNSPINSLVSNPISSSIPINHLARANSFIPINNNLVNQPNNSPAISSDSSATPINNNSLIANNPLVNNSIQPVAPISNSIAVDPITNSIPSNVINKPITRGRQSASGILEYNTKPVERTSHAVRPRPERVQHNNSEHSVNRGRQLSRVSRVTEPSVSNHLSSNEGNSIESNSPIGGSGFGQRIRG